MPLYSAVNTNLTVCEYMPMFTHIYIVDIVFNHTDVRMHNMFTYRYSKLMHGTFAHTRIGDRESASERERERERKRETEREETMESCVRIGRWKHMYVQENRHAVVEAYKQLQTYGR